MANEIKVQLRLSVSNGDFKDNWYPPQLSIDQAAQGFHSQIAVVGTSEESVAVGDISTLGWIVMRNLDSENYVTYGPDDGEGSMVPMGRMNAGEFAVLRLEPGITLKWQADTANCKVEYRIYED